MKKLQAVSFCLDCDSLFDGVVPIINHTINCPECGSENMVLSVAAEIPQNYKRYNSENSCKYFVDGVCENVTEGFW